MLEELTTLAIFHFFLIFARMGAVLMVLPGIGEIYVSPKARLSLALAISVVMVPIIGPKLPLVPDSILTTIILLFSETIIGLLIGGIARMLQSILHIAGMIIAFQSSLATALLFDANQGSQGSVIGNFMTLIGVTLLFVTDLHHVILMGIADSYDLFKTGEFLPTGEFAELSAKTLSDGFMVAFKMSSPLIITGLLLYLGAGILGRLMPTMQVFFVIIPLQLYKSFVMIALILSVTMMWYLKHFEDSIIVLFGY